MKRTELATPEMDRAWDKLKEELTQGLRHGFFEYTLTCETQAGKRRLTLIAGRSYRFSIPDSEVSES